MRIDRTTGETKQFLYQLDSASNGCNELEVIADNRLLVLERDGLVGLPGGAKRLYEIDLTGATDISGVTNLPATAIPEGVRPVKKLLFLDLLDERWRLAGESFPEKIEGITLGPMLADGSRVLLVSSDNDFRIEQPTFVYAFGVKFSPR